jgi:integrase
VRSSIDDVETVTWDTFCHTAASHWLMAGVTTFEVARRLGHALTNITERVYAHLLPGGQQKSAHALDYLVG